MNSIKTACLYLRYSSASQTEQSIEGQLRVCRDYCERKDINIVATYIDRATSASHNIAKRTEFLRMIADAEKHPFDAVIVYKLDRFSRSRYDSAIYRAKLKKHGVALISATENLSDTPESIILESVLEGMAEFYSAELSQKIKRGLNESAHKHKPIGGQVPLGFRFENQQYVIDPDTAHIVKELFQRYAAGETLVDIGQSFNDRGYRTSKGAKFTKNSFHRMLSNKRYIGYYVFKDQEEPDVLPKLIDELTWNKVQKRVKENQQAPGSRKAKDPYILLGKLICGHCGEKMVGDSGLSKSGKDYHYYTCSTRKRKKNCDKRPMPKKWIEDLVIQQAKDLLSDEYIEHLAKVAVAENNRIISENTEIKALENRLTDIDKSLVNLVRAIEAGSPPDVLVSRISELEKEKAQVKKSLTQAQKEQIYLTEDHVIFWLEKFREGRFDDPQFRNQLVDMFIDTVIVWDIPDGYKITTVYNLTDNTTNTVKKTEIEKWQCSDIEDNAPLIQAHPNTAKLIWRRIVKREAD